MKQMCIKKYQYLTFIVENTNVKNKIIVLINTIKSGIEIILADLHIQAPNYLCVLFC